MVVTDHEFSNEVFAGSGFQKGEYEHCHFTGCNFEAAELSGVTFLECTFTECNLSLAKLNRTAIRDCVFSGCKMLGLRFDQCNPFLFSARFEKSVLNLSSFFKLQIRKTVFSNCVLQEVDFSEADLSDSVFAECDLLNARFEQCNLEKVDFRTAFHYRIDPELNRMKKARFSESGLAGLLTRYNIRVD